jgi:DNA-directed RNA polymerase specialized sigma24 family protein
LDPKERELVELRQGSLGWDEIGERLDLPATTACDRYERALKKLKLLGGASYFRSTSRR